MEPEFIKKQLSAIRPQQSGKFGFKNNKLNLLFGLLFLIAIFITPSSVFALPQDPEVVHGNASFEQPNSNTLNISATDNSIIQYSSFNIAQHETVNFQLPSVNAFSLNRILGNSQTQIHGQLIANGNLILVNTNGFHFGSTAQVQVGGLIASTLDISNQDFLNSQYLFGSIDQTLENKYAGLINDGSIQTREGGFAILIASAVENNGLIAAPLGTAALASGDVITVGISGNGMISIGIDEPTSHQVLDFEGNPISDQIKNTGSIEATAGNVILKAEAVDSLFHKGINLQGTVSADTVMGNQGMIQIISSDIIRINAFIQAIDSVISITSDEKIELGGTYQLGNGSLTAHAGTDLEIIAKTEVFGEATLKANRHIMIHADVTIHSGNVEFSADTNLDGLGSFYQSEGTTITTVGSGDVLISSSSPGTLANIVTAGSLIIENALHPLNLESDPIIPTSIETPSVSPLELSLLPDSVVNSTKDLYIGISVTMNGSNGAYYIGSDWVNYGTFVPGQSLVEFLGPEISTLYGSNNFYNLKVTEPGKLLHLESDTTQTISGTLTLRGAPSKLVQLRSTNPNIPWKINIQGQHAISFVDMMNGTNVNIHGPPIPLAYSKNSLNNTGFDFSQAGPVWIGSSNSLYWSDPNNWNGGFIPGSGDIVTFSSESPSSIIDSGFQGSIAGLTLSSDFNSTINLQTNLNISGNLYISGGTFSANAHTLQIGGNFSTAGGTFDAGTSTVTFVDNSRTSQISGNNTFYNFTVTTPEKYIVFQSGDTQHILGTWKTQGSHGRHVRLIASDPDSQWLVNPEGVRDMTYTWVENSHNLHPDIVIMTESTNRGGSTNWDPTGTWTNGDAGNNNWSDPDNWSGLGGAIPGSGDDVVFDATNTDNSNMDQAFTINSLTIASGYTGTISLNGDLTVNTNYAQSAGTVNGGVGTINISGNATLSGGLLNTSTGTMTVSTMVINTPAIVRMATNGILRLSGSGTPLTGTGTLDTSTNTPNTVEFTSQDATDITLSTPISSFHNLTIDPVFPFNQVGGTLTLNTGVNENNFFASIIDAPNDFAYFVSNGDSNNSTVVKVRLSTLTRIGAINLNSGETNASTFVADLTNQFAYIGTTNSTNTAEVVKIDIDPSNFSRIGAITLNAGESIPTEGAVVDAANGYAYFASSDSGNPGDKVIRFDIDPVRQSAQPFDFARDGEVLFNDASETAIGASIIDLDNSFAYFGTATAGTDPARIIKVDVNPSNFAKIGTLTLSTNETFILSAVFDSNNDFGYFGTWDGTTNPGRVVKVNLANGTTFTRVGSITMNSGEVTLDTAVIDPGNEFAYFIDDFGVVDPDLIKIDISPSNFSRVSSIQLDPGTSEGIRTGVIDTTNGFAYFPTTNGDPGQVFKVRISSPNNFRIGTSGGQTLTVNGNLTLGAEISADNFDPTINVTGNFTINDSSFIASDTSSITVGGNWTNNGTFNANGQTVIFNGSSTQSVNNGSDNFNNVTYSGSSVLQLTATTTMAGTLSVSNGDFQLNSNTLNVNSYSQTGGTFTGGAGTMNITGNTFFINSGTFSAPANLSEAGNFTVTGTAVFQNNNGTVTLNGTSDQTVTLDVSVTFFNLTINNTGAGGSDDIIIAGTSNTLDVDGILTITDGDLDVNTNDPTINTAGNVTVGASGSIDTGSGTWTFDGTGTSTLSGNSQSFGTAIIDGTAKTVQLGSAANFTSLTINADDIFSLAGSNTTITTLSNNNIFRLRGSETVTLATNDTNSGTWEYVGAGGSGTFNIKDFGGGTDYFNLTIAAASATETFQLAASLSVGNILTVSEGIFSQNFEVSVTSNFVISGGTVNGTDTASTTDIDINGNFVQSSGTFNSTPGNMNISGNFDRSGGGTFNGNGGTVILDGTDQQILGSTTFNNLTKTVTVSRTLTFQAGQTQTVSGTLTLQGASGNLLSLRSSASPSLWRINPTVGSISVSFVDVQDGQNLNGTFIDPANSTDSGNNFTWFPKNLDGLTPLVGVTIALAINGGSTAGQTDVTDGAGIYTITGLNLNNGDIITVYIDNDTNDAVTVAISNGQSFTDLNLIVGELILRSYNGSTVTNAILDIANDAGPRCRSW